LHGRFEKRTQ